MEPEAKEQLNNPYKTPQSSVVLAVEPQPYEGKIYSVLSIAIATLFGSVLAGGLLLYSNFEVLAQKSLSYVTIVITIIATIIFLFACLLVEYPSSLLYLTANFIIAVLLMPLNIYLQRDSIDAHKSAGRPFHSVFRAAGIGIICFFALGIMLSSAIALFVAFA